jgi:hypothetical protein
VLQSRELAERSGPPDSGVPIPVLCNSASRWTNLRVLAASCRPLIGTAMKGDDPR